MMPPAQLFSFVPADLLGTDSGEGCRSISSGDYCVVVVAAGARTKGKGEPGIRGRLGPLRQVASGQGRLPLWAPPLPSWNSVVCGGQLTESSV